MDANETSIDRHALCHDKLLSSVNSVEICANFDLVEPAKLIQLIFFLIVRHFGDVRILIFGFFWLNGVDGLFARWQHLLIFVVGLNRLSVDWPVLLLCWASVIVVVRRFWVVLLLADRGGFCVVGLVIACAGRGVRCVSRRLVYILWLLIGSRRGVSIIALSCIWFVHENEWFLLMIDLECNLLASL